MSVKAQLKCIQYVSELQPLSSWHGGELPGAGVFGTLHLNLDLPSIGESGQMKLQTGQSHNEPSSVCESIAQPAPVVYYPAFEHTITNAPPLIPYTPLVGMCICEHQLYI